MRQCCSASQRRPISSYRNLDADCMHTRDIPAPPMPTAFIGGDKDMVIADRIKYVESMTVMLEPRRPCVALPRRAVSNTAAASRSRRPGRQTQHFLLQRRQAENGPAGHTTDVSVDGPTQNTAERRSGRQHRMESLSSSTPNYLQALPTRFFPVNAKTGMLDLEFRGLGMPVTASNRPVG